MILKLRSGRYPHEWVYYDHITEFKHLWLHITISDGTIKVFFENNDGSVSDKECDFWDLAYLQFPLGNHDNGYCKLLTFKVQGEQNDRYLICNTEMYLLNDDGKTIERL